MLKVSESSPMKISKSMKTSKKIITLLTDFGLKDPYVAEMKAVILSICPEAKIVDISHLVRKFDVRMGAFLLAQVAPFFPESTVHVAVVDPGVGTERRPIIVKTTRSLYVGPDNGVLMLSAKREGIEHIYEIRNPQYLLPVISRTFHGRDIFSPVAAYLSLGVPPSSFGPEIKDPRIPEFTNPCIRRGGVAGEIIYIDDFGNLVTNINSEILMKAGIKEGDDLEIRVDDRILHLKLCKAYGEVTPGKMLTVIGGSGFLEISVNLGSAADTLKCEIETPVNITLKSKGSRGA